MTMYATTVKPGNEISGPWVGQQGCGVDQLHVLDVHTKGSDSIQFAMTPRSINLLATYAGNMASCLKITMSLTSHTSTKLKIQPLVHTNKSMSVYLFTYL